MRTGVDGAAEHAHTTAWIASVLRNRIAAGELAPGCKLSEQALATAIGVSRNTLRQAFTILAGESIVSRIPNRGVFVASPGVEEVREIYRIRRVIEPADFHSQYVEHNVELVQRLRAGQREEAAAGLRNYLDLAEAELLAHLGHVDH